MTDYRRSLLQIHITTILFGLVAVYVKSFTLPALILVFGRTLFASLALLLFSLFRRQSISLGTTKEKFTAVVLGLILAFHWWSFFYAIEVGTVTVALLTAASFPLFVTFLEPWLFKERLKRTDVFTSLLVFVGVALVIPKYEFGNNLTVCAFFGTMAGLTMAFISLINRGLVSRHSPIIVAFYQNFFAMLVLMPLALQLDVQLGPHEWTGLVVLGVVFTAISHGFFISSMTHLRAQLCGVITSFAPVYGIAAAWFLLDEDPALRTLLGGGLILVGTVLGSISHRPSVQEVLATEAAF